jgi:hypothetical protein
MFSLLMAILFAGDAKAQPQYAFAYTGTPGGNVFPLGSTTSNKVQWMYYQTHFTPNLPSTGLINTIYLSPNSSATGGSTFSNLNIKMGNTTTVTGMTGTAWHTGLTTVYSSTSTTLSWTANNWIPITLQTPFFYSGGNLILEISETAYTTGMTINQISTFTGGGRQWGNVTGTAPTGSGTGQFVIGFDISPANCTGTPLAPVITTAAMSTAAPLCTGSTASLSASNPNGPILGLSYQWQSGSSSTGPFTNVTNGTGATTLNYTTGPNTATTWYRLAITCSFSSTTTYSAPYQVLVGATQPGTITGRPSSCPGDVAVYSVPNVSGHTYNWTLPAGWSGTSTTNSITVTMGPNPGTISVTATGCGGTSIARTLVVIAGSAPATPGAVTGPSFVCPGTTQTFSVAAVTGANTYSWTLPNGWTGTSTTNSITVNTDTTSGTVSVKGVNGCGVSQNSSKPITVLNSLGNPGTITTSSTNGVYCSGKLYNFSINAVPGATSYQWVLPSGWSGTNTGTSIQAFAGSAGGQLTATAYVSCATSVSSVLSVPVSATVTPSVSVATTAPAICQGLPTTFTATPTNGGTSPFYQWKKNNLNVTGTGATYTDASLVTGDVISVALTSSSTCRLADTVASNYITATVTPTVTPGISISSVPVITTCAGTTLNFTTNSTGGGTAPTYQWYRNGNLISGATGTTYSSSTFSNGDTVTIKMATSAICYSMPVATSNKVALIINDLINPSINITASSTDPGQPITFTAIQNGGGATPGYQWMLNGVAIPGETSGTYTTSTLIGGDHVSVRLQSYDPCATPTLVMSNTIIIGSPAGVAGTSGWQGAVSLYPNPSGGRFTVSADWNAIHIGKRVSVDVYNVLGQMMYHSEVAPDRTKWSYDVRLSDAIPNGHYTIRLTTQDGMKANMPLIINR